MGTVAIVQARMGSTRLPGKVLKEIVGRPMLWHIVQRLQFVSRIENVVVATSDQSADQAIEDFCSRFNIDCFRGSENDVLDRFYKAALQYSGDPVIRITGDCPFVDPGVVDDLLDLYNAGEYDHVGVATGAGAVFMNKGRFPDGLDAECFSFSALKRSWAEATQPSDREHVTPYMWRVPGRFHTGTLFAEQDYSHLRWTVDNEVDFLLVSRVYEALYREGHPFLMKDILSFLAANPDLMKSNQHLIGREGYISLWEPND